MEILKARKGTKEIKGTEVCKARRVQLGRQVRKVLKGIRETKETEGRRVRRDLQANREGWMKMPR